MLNWIETWWHRGTGLIQRTALNWIHVALHAIAGIIHTVFGAVDQAWKDIQHPIWLIFSEAVYTARLLANLTWWLFNRGIPDLANYAFSIGRSIWNEIRRVYDWIAREVSRAIHEAETYALSVWNWAYQHVVKPIADSLTSAWDWITKRGETLWYYLTHPDKLADLLLYYLAGAFVRASDGVIEVMGIAILSLLMRNARRFLHIIEDIIAAVL